MAGDRRRVPRHFRQRGMVDAALDAEIDEGLANGGFERRDTEGEEGEQHFYAYGRSIVGIVPDRGVDLIVGVGQQVCR